MGPEKWSERNEGSDSIKHPVLTLSNDESKTLLACGREMHSSTNKFYAEQETGLCALLAAILQNDHASLASIPNRHQNQIAAIGSRIRSAFGNVSEKDLLSLDWRFATIPRSESVSEFIRAQEGKFGKSPKDPSKTETTFVEGARAEMYANDCGHTSFVLFAYKRDMIRQVDWTEPGWKGGSDGRVESTTGKLSDAYVGSIYFDQGEQVPRQKELRESIEALSARIIPKLVDNYKEYLKQVDDVGGYKYEFVEQNLVLELTRIFQDFSYEFLISGQAKKFDHNGEFAKDKSRDAFLQDLSKVIKWMKSRSLVKFLAYMPSITLPPWDKGAEGVGSQIMQSIPKDMERICLDAIEKEIREAVQRLESKS